MTDGAIKPADEPVAAGPNGHADTLVDSGLDAPARKPGGPAIGMRLGHYHVLRHLGSGAMGTVVEAHDETLDRRVAIKLLHERGEGRQERRLLREAQALARLSHPNVVQVYEVGEAAGHVFIAMELVAGQTLEAWQHEPRPWREVVEVYLQAGRGLAAAHAEGLIHRDFKPGNAIIDAQGRVRVLDFGLARESEGMEELQVSRSNSDAVSQLLADSRETDRALAEVLTRTGALLGTPAYMAPEQLGGQGGSAQSDQFNFCVALYEALYRSRPFPHASIGELITKVMGGEVSEPPGGTGVPRSLWPIVRRGLSRRPAERFESMDALLLRLQETVAPRSSSRWLVAGGLATTAVVAVWLLRPETEPPCRDAQALLEGVWDAAKATTVSEALQATGVSYAATTGQRVGEQLQGYADGWVATHTEACEATHVHQRQSAQVLDLRMRCLDERRRALGRTVDLLAHADASTVEHAVSIASGLPSLARCDDVAALQAELPPPEDPGAAAEVEALREQLAHVRGLDLAERIDDALRESEAVLERALAVGYGPLVADARFERGLALEVLGRYPEAEQELTAAFSLATELGYELAATRAAIELSSVTGRHMARLEAGRTWGVAGEALARRVEPDGSLQAKALRTAAIVEISDGRVDEAAGRFERALAILEGMADVPELELARALGDLGNLRMVQQRPDDALELYRRAAALYREELGEGHPALATGAINMGRVYEQRNELAQAEAEYRRAVTLWEGARAPDHPDVAIALNNLAVVFDKQGRPAEALALYERVLAVRKASLGLEHPYVAQTLVNMALSLRALGRLEEALARVEQAVALFESQGGENLEHTLTELAQTQLEMKRWDDALATLERVRPMRVETAQGDLGQVTMVDMQIAEARWGRGEHGAARELAQQVLERTKTGARPDPQTAAGVEQWLAGHPLP